MHANLDEEMARVVIERMEGDPGKPMNAADRNTLMEANKRLTAAMLSRGESHRRHLVSQGMSPQAAARHAAHRFGGF